MKTLIISILFIPLLFSCKNIVKKAGKPISKNISTQFIKSATKQPVKTSIRSFSKNVTRNMSSEVLALFKSGGYKEIKGTVKGASKSILISPKFDPHLTIPKVFTGDFDAIKFHKGDSRFVRNGLETNLGRMKRGLAPLYKDPTNTKKDWHGFSAFELHHGGQKSDPHYFALMGEDHKNSSKILHLKRTGSEINRNEFGAKERAPLYKELSEFIDTIL